MRRKQHEIGFACKYSLAGRIELLLLQGTKRMGRPIRLRKKSEVTYLIVE